MRTDTLKITDAIWKKRISAARKRREPFEDIWQFYARLHSDGKRAVRNTADDYDVSLDGDIVKVSLVFRNLEQTMGFLELEDFGVSAQANSYTREQTNGDTQRQAVVEQGLYNSMNKSGLFQGAERLDQIKLDALLCGHGISYSSWETIEEEVVVDRLPMLEEVNGLYQQKLDKNGEPVFEEIKEVKTLFENVRDDRISPMQFLLDSTAMSMGDAGWMGFESIIKYEDLKADKRYQLPDSIKPSSFKVRTLAGDEEHDDDYFQEDSVRVIVVWDKTTRTLIHFIESSESEKKGKNKTSLHRIYEIRHPVRFDHPGDSPFSWLVPIPASDIPFGISQVEHIRIPALEADVLRTRRSNLARTQKRLITYNKDKINEADMEAALESDKDLEALGVSLQDGDDITKITREFQTPGVPDELLRFAHEPEDDVRKNSGIQETPFTGADTATESEIQRMIGQARVNRKRNKMFKFLRSVARTHLAFMREFAPEGQQLMITLPDGMQEMVVYGREAFQGEFHLDVTPGGGANTISPIRQKQLQEAYVMVKDNLGPEAGLILTRQILTQLDVPNMNAIMQAAQKHLLGGAMSAPSGNAQLPNPVNPAAVNNGQAIREAVNPME